MSDSDRLRAQRAGTVINLNSTHQERELGRSLPAVAARLEQTFGLKLHHERAWRLSGPMRPDGGILSLRSKDDLHPALIVEVKNQGTNDRRLLEGKKAQSKGNAIERLGKNVIGFRTAMLAENIFPFVCFGYGCDFAENSSILDRVTTIAMFGPLNRVQVVNEGEHGSFNRGSYFFREQRWTAGEMEKVMYEVAERSVYYYFAKYGKAHFDLPTDAVVQQTPNHPKGRPRKRP